MTEIVTKDQLKWAFARAAVFFVPLIMTVGVIFGHSEEQMRWFANLESPNFFPSSSYLPWIWALMFLIQGIAIAMIWQARGNRLRTSAVLLFFIHFILTLTLPNLTFEAQSLSQSFVVCSALAVLQVVNCIVFWKIRSEAGILMALYLIWWIVISTALWQMQDLNPDSGYLPSNTVTFG